MERRVIQIGGIVQGVGFRPFVYGLAMELGLAGTVRNEGGIVRIDVEGPEERLDRFLSELRLRPPALARIERLTWERQPVRGERDFRIIHSEETRAGEIFISPDVATCQDCLGELFNPADRRFRYPFINCTNCGPRLTIVTGAPYDRAKTTMAGFAMCPACRAEYENPADRRFHAQPVACSVCGPQITLHVTGGRRLQREDALAGLVESLRAGKIAAIKGLGGYHLACNAADPEAVRELRKRKHRDEKPFAVMMRDVESIAAVCEMGEMERDLLRSGARPIVLLRKQGSLSGGLGIDNRVAPGNPYLGVMLPYTPLHHLLMHDLKGIPLVMTSGNQSDEPIAYLDEDAFRRLKDIADVFLTHDRPIHVRCDDSVTRVVLGAEIPVRRSRGYAPRPIGLPMECPIPVLAVGGQLKATFALAKGNHAFLSQHMGDLDELDAYKAFERDVDLYRELLAIEPECIVHDLHPDYASTHYAQRRAAAKNLPLVAVQHHHAHMASCMGENGLAGPVIGVSFDGTGYGTDGTIWGGEFLVGDYRDFRRAAHLRYVGMPGGEKAIREPWRMAAAHLIDAGLGLDLLRDRIDGTSLGMIEMMIRRQLRTPQTSSVGRLFDAVASILGVRDRVTYEGQAAVELERGAAGGGDKGTRGRGDKEKEVKDEGGRMKDEGENRSETREARSENDQSAIRDPQPGINSALSTQDSALPSQSAIAIDSRPIIRSVVSDLRGGVDRAVIARRFHEMVAEITLDTCRMIRNQTHIGEVTLSGGVFLNELLTTRISLLLEQNGFRVYRHHQVPPNDGGISLGQVAVAAARLGRPE